MKMVYTIAAMLLAANVAVAQDTADTNTNTTTRGDISEFHQHAMGGQLEITPHVMYDMNTVSPGSGLPDTDLNGFRLGSEVEYGIMDRLSVGADLTYRSWDGDGSAESSGLEDVVLFTRGSRGMNAGRLTYGANLGVSLEDDDTDNAATGGLSLRPYVGYEMGVGPGLWGGQVNYNWRGERTSAGGAKTESGGGVGLATFYEYGLSDRTTLGGAISYSMDAEVDDSSAVGLSVYAPIGMQNNMTVIPRLDYDMTDLDGDAEASELAIGAALRWMM